MIPDCDRVGPQKCEWSEMNASPSSSGYTDYITEENSSSKWIIKMNHQNAYILIIFNKFSLKMYNCWCNLIWSPDFSTISNIILCIYPFKSSDAICWILKYVAYITASIVPETSWRFLTLRFIILRKSYMWCYMLYFIMVK